jgi:hypothetical protein
VISVKEKPDTPLNIRISKSLSDNISEASINFKCSISEFVREVLASYFMESKQLAKLANTDTETHSNTETNKDIKTPAPQAAQEVKDVFDFWKTTLNHPRSNLDDKRKALIKKTLKSGYSVDDLKSAINGCSNTPHNMGDNDRGQRYDSIELILRDSGQIDRFMGNDVLQPITRSTANKKTSANIAAAQEFLRGDL